jgi:hypothetical protein
MSTQLDNHSIVTSLMTKLNSTFADAGILVTDEDKAESIAKLLGLVEGVRKLGGVRPTDTGYLFAGVNPAELAAAKEKAQLESEIERLKTEIETRKAKLAAK